MCLFILMYILWQEDIKWEKDYILNCILKDIDKTITYYPPKSLEINFI
jgi:hypothetical protein